MLRSKLAFAVILVLAGTWSYRQFSPANVFFPRVNRTSPPPDRIQRLLKESEKRLALDPENLDALVELGIAYFFMGPERYPDSLNAFNAAWRMSAFDPRLFYYSGILYEEISLFEEAEKQYRRFLKHVPKDREIELRLARLLYRMGKWADSVRYYEQLVKSNPNDVTSTVNLGLAYSRRYEQIRQELSTKSKPTQKPQKADEPAQTDPSMLMTRAIEFLEKAAKLDPELDEGLHLELAKLYFEKNDWQNCVLACQSELKRKNSDPETLKLITLSYEKLGDKNNAYTFASLWEKSDPKNRQARSKAGQLKPRSKK